MTTETTGVPTAVLHAWHDDESGEYWIAHDLADLEAQQRELTDDFTPVYDWARLDDDAKKEIAFVDEPTHGLASMASEDDNPADCQMVTKTWGEWAALHGRGYFGGGRS